MGNEPAQNWIVSIVISGQSGMINLSTTLFPNRKTSCPKINRLPLFIFLRNSFENSVYKIKIFQVQSQPNCPSWPFLKTRLNCGKEWRERGTPGLYTGCALKTKIIPSRGLSIHTKIRKLHLIDGNRLVMGAAGRDGQGPRRTGRGPVKRKAPGLLYTDDFQLDILPFGLAWDPEFLIKSDPKRFQLRKCISS